MSLFPFRTNVRTNTAPSAPPAPPVLEPGSATDPYRLAVSKALRQLVFIAQSYGLEKCPIDPQRAAVVEHDLAIIHAHGDLKSMFLELLARDNQVIAEFRFEFIKSKSAVGGQDYANGIELPLINQALVVGHRFLVRYNGKPRTYASLLKLRWTDAQGFP